MIVGIGIDIVELERIKNIYDRFGLRFLRHILAPSEMATLPACIYSYLGSRFAAKEAAVKALGTGFMQGITPISIIIDHHASGQPRLVFHGKALTRANQLGISHAHISISHERAYAAAMVILEKLS